MVRKSNRKTIISATSLIIAVAMLFSITVFMPENVSAASGKKPAKVRVISSNSINQMITVKWKSAKKAKSYQVYAKIGNTKWKKMATVKATKKSSYTYRIRNCQWASPYKVKVRAVNGKKKGAWSRIYSGMLGEMTTLEKYTSNRPNLTFMLEYVFRYEYGLNYHEMKDMSISENTIIVNSIHQVDATDKEIMYHEKYSCMQELTHREYKADMKKYMTYVKNKTGISGIKVRHTVYDEKDNYIFSYTYQ